MRIEFDGACALVTGSTSGIGKAIAMAFAASGARVIVNGRSQVRADEVANEIVKAGGIAIGIGADLSHPSGVENLVTSAVEVFGRIDILINNAGRAYIGSSEAMPIERWEKLLALNLTAPFLTCQSVGALMIEQRKGVIVNITSIAGEVALPKRAAYTAAKHGLVGLTKALAVEWAGSGVRVVAVGPGYVETEMTASGMDAGEFSLADPSSRTPLGRMANSNEIADVVVFVASEHASYLTGSHLLVDGGWTAYGGFERINLVSEK